MNTGYSSSSLWFHPCFGGTGVGGGQEQGVGGCKLTL